MDFLSTLNEQQREAVIETDGPLLILAGAGSGKTRVITYRIAYLISERGVAPYNILAVTFTNKAAEEMRERVKRLLSDSPLSSAPLISTFHSLCVRILRQHIEALNAGYTRSFTIYDQDDSVRLVKACIKDLGYDDKQLAPRATQGAISGAKNRQGDDAESYAARVEYNDEKRTAIARVFKLYEERLVNNNALDFDDLLIKTVQLLRRVPDVREYYNDKFRYILVDEYQDTNMLQFALIRFLTEKQQNICVVGDEDQSVYKWRGADIGNILNFEQHYPNAKVIRLEQNYRSTQTILDVAGAVVKNNTERKGKTLWTSNPSGERIRYYQAFDSDAEARFVAAKIEEHARVDPGIRAAVLYRTNAQSRVFEEAMRRAGIHYNIVGGFSFYERMEVRDIISYLKLALNPHDSIALMRVINSPARGLGKQTLDQIERHAKDYAVSHWETISILTEQGAGLSPRAVTALKNFQQIITNLVSATTNASSSESPVSDVVKAAILDTGYANALKSENSDEAEARLENLQELVNAAVDYDQQEQEGLRDFIDHAALVSDADQYKRDAPVTLMTMHAAKGLEFPLVFIVGLEDGLFPHSRSAADPAELEEERRLCYVAITRAERFLYVTHAMKRRVYGEEMAAEPSQFLNEMPLDLMEDLSRGKSWLSFARSSTTLENKHAVSALRGDTRERTKFAGKTYDSVDSIAEYFRKRGQQLGGTDSKPQSAPTIKHRPAQDSATKAAPRDSSSATGGDFGPGAHVRHPKYGRGLVLRREGTGDSAKLTVSFPGFGQKKLIEKYAGLEKA
ncbi:MAG TPA: UvrD-helicase domain-containing protein [Pyrinomonadaceae bacterium]|jgi:DNA helicase-2/ATP-dependent DNA helicase PcrA|nr:UvrD-helicase domain-containing protein [Pyrinomonadaceae bacterium]